MPYRRYKPGYDDNKLMLHGGMINCICDDCHITMMLLVRPSGWASEIIIKTMWRWE